MRSGICGTGAIVTLLALLHGGTVAALETRQQCVIHPSMEIRLSSATVGLLTEVPVERGETVQEGQILARLESSVQEVELSMATLRAGSNIELEIARARAELTETRGARIEELFARQVATEAQYEELQAERRLVALETERAALEAEAALMERDRAERLLALRQIRSPINGIVVERMLSPGEFVHQDAPVLHLARIDPLHVEAYLPASMLNAVSVGTEATVFPQEPVGGAYQAVVVVVDQVVDAASSTFGIRLALPNPDTKISAGLRCEVAFASDG
ncbi:efflux RND transporter periplasmic adaptor subunit [Rhodobacteraceae bacterium 2376]|uniref:Efflux RND transporter periplasmic adaptor subunit n=1 Tax=Rhabdonatronobacter sediminivivens TaxID=2743469 RepID=A0A7Z0I138_9RHOB|nr:efflux RND transporter periplasmic adaptor subunit [Rhabdonatronobacter sediminivivens]NYS26006.1 efflux RND transporter periplasmic adaptor subunit [Rhabdonatronobacter sediminivivens]